jgi:hypothetical protein
MLLKKGKIQKEELEGHFKLEEEEIEYLTS